MKINHSEMIEEKPVDMEGAADVTIRWLVSSADGAPNFAMRQFEVAPGGHTPYHSHPFEHIVYVVSGTGAVMEGDQEHPLVAGDVIFVQPDEEHQFLTRGPDPMRFLCLVPNSAY